MTTSAVVYLFNSNAEGVPSWYGGEFDPAFLRAVSGADPRGLSQTSVFRGDALIATLAEKVTEVSSTARGSSHTRSHDMDVYRTVVWDLADALFGQWRTVDPDTFPLILAKMEVHCICVPTLRPEFRQTIDSNLRGSRGYLGAIELDLGNPIRRYYTLIIW